MADPFLSEIRIMSFNHAPKSWAQCDGQFMPINQNQGLFSLLGTTYGGNGQTTFALPNLRGQVPIHFGGAHTLGEAGGTSSVTVILSQLPTHTHFMQAKAASATLVGGAIPGTGKSLAQAGAATATPPPPVNLYASPVSLNAMAANSTTSVGGNQPHNNMMPYLALNFCIALIGIFPSRN